ncbi:MAG: hypothetical protein RL380_986, partial [Verrucomicrobiota bacterium]
MSSNFSRLCRSACFGLAFFLCHEFVATAADVTWDGGASGTGSGWLQVANWAGDVVPGANDNAIFSSVGSATVVTIPMSTAGGTQQVGCVTIDATRVSSLTLSNSSSTTSGYLQLNGVGGVLLSNASSIRFSMTNGASRFMALALNASGEIYAGAGATNRIYIEVTEFGGVRGFTKTGGGYLILNNTNSTYTGGTTNSAGTIAIDQYATFGTGVAPLVLAGGDLRSENTRASAPIQNPIIMTADSTIYGNSTLASLRVFPFGGSINTVAGTLRVGNRGSVGGSTFELRLNGGGYNLTRPIIIGDPSLDTVGTFSELGLNNTNTSGDQTISGNISGQGFILRGATASANGSTIFTGSNTYSGGTFINAGTVFANNTSGSALGTGAVAVTNANGTLAGNGTLLASVFIATNSVGGNLAPGSLATNVGKLTVNDLTLGENAVYLWTITNAAGTAGVGWDLITASNSWTDAASASNYVTLKVDSLGAVPAGWSAGTARDWTIIQSPSAIGFDRTHFAIDTS